MSEKLVSIPSVQFRTVNGQLEYRCLQIEDEYSLLDSEHPYTTNLIIDGWSEWQKLG